MRRVLLAMLLVACGDDGETTGDVGIDAPPRIDAPPSSCQTIPAMGQFVPRDGNPRLLAGTRFSDGKRDLAITDPDVRWDAATGLYQLYFAAPHGTSPGAADVVPTIRHAVSPDKTSWTYVEEPALVASPDVAAWDHTHAGAPTVAYNPAAPPDRRYLLLYAGASRTLPGHTFPEYSIGAAFSPDGITFTRVPAAESIDGKAGLVLTGARAYPTATGAIVADPEVVLVDGTYHLYFSSFACTGAGCATRTAYGVGHATSPDGVTWTVLQAPFTSLLRTSTQPTTGGAQPSVIHDAGHCRWELWLTNDATLAGGASEHDNQPVDYNNMTGVFRAESLDGTSWSVDYSRARDLTWNAAAPRPGERLGLLSGVDVTANLNGRLMVYVGFDDQNVPDGLLLPDRTATGFRSGVMVLNIATRDLP